MNINSEINWLNIISNREFQSYLDLNLLKETSMISKLTREKLNPLLYKNLELKLHDIKFEFNALNIAHDNIYSHTKYNYKTLKEESNCSIEDSLNDFVISLSDIKKYAESFYLGFNRISGYYLYSLINLFDRLTELKIYSCDVPFAAFANIEKTLPNLIRLELDNLRLVASTTDDISEKNITFPSNLSYLKFFDVYMATTNLLSDPFKFLFSRERGNFVNFTLPKISIPSLKSLDFRPKHEEIYELEKFLDFNPNLESLLIRDYDLNITDKLNSLKSLDIDECIYFDNIDQSFRLNSINTLKFSANFVNYEVIIKLCQLCPNLVNLNLLFCGKIQDFQSIIDKYLAPELSKLQSLKTLNIIKEENNNQTLDFAKFDQIEKLKIQLKKGSVLDIEFENCKSLTRVEFKSYQDKFTDEFKRKFDKYSNWMFNFSGYTTRGYKI
jgi:hypothetical protein